MSEKERDRLGVVRQVTAGLVSVRQGAELLGISTRQLRRSIRRYECDGDVGLTHQARGRESNRRVAEAARERAVEQLRQDDWSDFGPTFAAEKLAEYVDIVVGRETVRQWMIEEDLWKPRPRKGTHRSWRQRRECFGELVQMDTSIHDWFEGRGEKVVLICLVDDATGRKFARFFASDTTAANMAILRDYIRRYGRPRALYADKASHFVTTRAADVEEQLDDRQPETQVGRALRELGIEQIIAHSPQAKGRIERTFDTDQDRLVKEMRLRGISTIPEANDFLDEEYLAAHNARFAVVPACPADAHRAADGHDLDAILSRQESRVVTNDYTIQYYNQRYQIQKRSTEPGLRGAKVIVEKRLDESVWLRHKGSYVQAHELPAKPARQAEASAPKQNAPTPRVGHTPAPDHPWREAARRDARLRAARQEGKRPRVQPPPRPNGA